MESNNSKYIVIKFSELSLKGKNKKEFVGVLLRNIKNKMLKNNIDVIVKNVRTHIEIFGENDELNKVKIVLKEIVGISNWSTYFKLDANKEEIEKLFNEVLSSYPEDTKFRVSPKIISSNLYSDKKEIIDWVAWYATNILNFKIDLKKYDVDFNIRIENDIATIFFEKENGIQGLPAGANGKALTLLSGGIDSPVAAFKTITRGVNSSFITFLTPRTSEAQTLNKIKSLAKQVNKYNGIDGKLFFVNFEKVQEEIMKLDNTSYRITLLRRYFMRFSEMISKQYGYKFLITGDSLGQVASQTPESMTQIDNATKQLIVRPLVSMSKNEIIKIGEQINTYKISIQPGDDMCSLFTPNDPIIFPKEKMVTELEKKLENIDDVLKKVLLEDVRTLDLKEI